LAITEAFAGVAVSDHRAAAAWYDVVGLEGRGLALEPIETVPGVVRKAVITDPDGNRITFGESLGSDDG
jgi:hypothetical protein